MPLRKVLIANRGEIALRIIRACKELGLRSVAVYSEADRWANYAAQSDESYLLGPAPARESYLRIDRLLEIARRSGADAIHPGYGFLAENADFSEACAKAGVKFIGPGADSIRRAGNKIRARRLAEKNGIPVVPGLSRPIGEADALAFAREHGFPVLLKAAGGGGGKGMRVVREAKELPRALREASGEAQSAFGDSEVFIERYIGKPRHVEIQILADSRGNVVHLGERECSIQRRHQKLVEESPSVAMDEDLRRRMGDTAKKIAKLVRYEGAGTCEFLLDEDRKFYFLEVNTRLQVEHPVTEMVTGLDLVKEQIAIAEGARLGFKQGDVEWRGHAIEARICAEDPFTNFAPSTGEIGGLRFPAGPFVRVDSDLTPRTRVSVYYDSLVAKLIVWGRDRKTALGRMLRALREFKVVGVQTTIPFLIQLFQDRRFREGKIHTKFIDTQFNLRNVKAEHHLEASILAAVLEAQRREQTTPRYASPRPLSPWKMSYRQERR